MKMLHIPFLSLLITALTLVSVQGEDVHIVSGLQSSDPNDGSRKCLNVKSFSNGVPVQTYGCDEDPQSSAQLWAIPLNSGPIQVANSPDFCLDAININTSNKVVLWVCNGSPQQQWVFTGNQYQLARNPDFCLDVPSSAFADGVQVQTYACGGGENQVWQNIGN